mmetsp:Transcript_56660/g.166352  ORF Transcript_56660/g.166352 Transcript_56660/m.166352 type:complete len:296 (+) Transcript_56660:284-1171(+)
MEHATRAFISGRADTGASTSTLNVRSAARPCRVKIPSNELIVNCTNWSGPGLRGSPNSSYVCDTALSSVLTLTAHAASFEPAAMPGSDLPTAGRQQERALLLRHLLVLLPLRQDELLAELRLLLRLRGQAVCLRDGLYLGQRHGVPAAFPRRPPLVPRRLVQDPGRPRSGVGASLARAPRRRAAGGAPRARGAAAEQGSSVGAERWAGGRASGGSPAAGILVHRAPTATGALLGHLQRRPDQRGRVEDGRGRGASGRGGRATPSHGGGCRRAVGRNGALYRAMSLLPLPLLELAA